MSRLRVTHTLGDLERDARKIPRQAVKDMRAVGREATITGNTVARDNARRTAGRHGKHYPKAFDWETRGSLFGPAGFVGEYGPNPGRRQGRMSFEGGSRNQPPHLDLAKSADLIGPALAQEVRRKLDSWFWL